MDMSAYVGSSFIKLGDVREGPRQETIANVQIGNFDRPELTFESGSVLSLNKTSVRILINAYGEDSRNWEGCALEVYFGRVGTKEGDKDAILVRPITPAKAPLPKKVAPDQAFDDEAF